MFMNINIPVQVVYYLGLLDNNTSVVRTTKSYVSFYVAARILDICAFNNIAQRLKSGLLSSLKVRLRCAYQP